MYSANSIGIWAPYYYHECIVIFGSLAATMYIEKVTLQGVNCTYYVLHFYHKMSHNIMHYYNNSLPCMFIWNFGSPLTPI